MLRLIITGSVFFFIFLIVLQNSIATNTNHCPPSACGRTNISYPFSLQTDPISCGDDKYKLSCENNFTVLHLFNGGMYHVHAINYDDFMIQLVDASVYRDDCSSIPSFPLTSYSFRFEDPYTLYKYKQETKNKFRWETLPAETIGFIKCQNPVNSSVYLDTSPCINSSTNSSLSHSGMYSYAYIGEIAGNDLRDGCSLEMVSLFRRLDSKNRISSFIEIHREIAFGFELSWHNINCRNCSSHLCYLDNKDHFHCLKTGFLVRNASDSIKNHCLTDETTSVF
ncbi:uncharacterized protein [Euphorbia lathyris]|uniref:uncharacterized protein n=1 Tax=Euphorbia lathyris TaxID=212925 RepID=UPI003313C5C6